MSDASNVSSNPTGEVRPRFHECLPTPGAEAFTPSRELCGAPSAALESRGLFHATTSGILAMEPALSWEMSV
jgi:hypothetical protein